MALDKTLLETGIRTALEAQLRAEFLKPSVKLALIKFLDKSPAAGMLSTAKDIYKALDNVEKLTEQIMSLPADKLAPPAAKLAVKKFTSNEWSNAISEGVTQWMSAEIAPILAKEISKVISDSVDLYIKSADVMVTIPIGTVTTGASTASLPNPIPIPLKGTPPTSTTFNPLTFGGLS
jgi:hypothetical protein